MAAPVDPVALKEVQRRLNLSLEEIVAEEKKKTGHAAKGGGAQDGKGTEGHKAAGTGRRKANRGKGKAKAKAKAAANAGTGASEKPVVNAPKSTAAPAAATAAGNGNGKGGGKRGGTSGAGSGAGGAKGGGKAGSKTPGKGLSVVGGSTIRGRLISGMKRARSPNSAAGGRRPANIGQGRSMNGKAVLSVAPGVHPPGHYGAPPPGAYPPGPYGYPAWGSWPPRAHPAGGYRPAVAAHTARQPAPYYGYPPMGVARYGVPPAYDGRTPPPGYYPPPYGYPPRTAAPQQAPAYQQPPPQQLPPQQAPAVAATAAAAAPAPNQHPQQPQPQAHQQPQQYSQYSPMPQGPTPQYSVPPAVQTAPQSMTPMPQQSSVRCGYQVRLSNVPLELTAKDLAEAFGSVSRSRVESVDLLRDQNGVATGDSLVVFGTEEDAHDCVRRYNGGDLNGRRLLAVFQGEVVSAVSS
mmetsp:Transcript_47357/g.101442  ORF Transcript_47357/g.101442 Transcript_47357/m.101442 type:complete len:463 (+) Transcript_47357:132-1520(+)